MTILAAIAGILIGGGAGYVISKNLSRFAGGCPIMCNPKVAVPYFAFMGMLLAVEAFT
jgi:ABC-type proline/glycine betaine transport system permease subunit